MISGKPQNLAYSIKQMQFNTSHDSVWKLPKPESKKNKISDFKMDTNELVQASYSH